MGLVFPPDDVADDSARGEFVVGDSVDADPGGFDRRRLLKGAAMTAGGLWLAPTVLTLAASPASASGTFGSAAARTATATPITHTAVTTPATAGIVMVTTVLTDSVAAQTYTFSAPSSVGTANWTAVETLHIWNATLARGITLCTYMGTYTASTSVTISQAWTGGATRAVSVRSFFPAGRYVTLVGGTSGTTASTTINAPGGTFPNDSGVVYWVAGWNAAAASQTITTGPSGYTSAASSIATATNRASVAMYQRSATAGAVFAATTASTAANINCSRGTVCFIY
jgi:hypothetical protein